MILGWIHLFRLRVVLCNVFLDTVFAQASSGYDEFVKAASLDNEIQFVETSSSDVAKLLFPNLKTNNVFVGLVKTEAEKYTAYGKLLDGNKFLLLLSFFPPYLQPENRL